jgi:hypothetical protein
VDRARQLLLDPHAHSSLFPLRQDFGSIGVMYLPNWLVIAVVAVWFGVIVTCLLTFGA